MRPTLLNPLFASITGLSGIGDKQEKLYRRLLGRSEDAPRIVDLLFHLPSGAIDRRNRPKLRDVVPGNVVTVAVTIDKHRPAPPRRRAPHLIHASDDTGAIVLTYFNARRDYLEKLYPVGEVRHVSGTAAFYDDKLQMVHPDRVVDDAGLTRLPLVEPVYPLTEGLGYGPLRRAIEAALARLPNCPNGRTRPGWRATAFPPLRMRCALCIGPPSLPILRRKARPGRGSPMTNYWPASWRSRWCARICGALPAAAARRGHFAHARGRGPALLAHALAAARHRGHRRRLALRTACCDCCRATSAPARPWLRCSPPPP